MFKNKKCHFSIWCDFLERDFIENEFVTLIEKGLINGATSNPSIFKDAILNSKAYCEDKKRLSKLTNDKKEIYEGLVIEDIKRASSKLLKKYQDNVDGFVSLEVDPNLCYDAEATFKEGKRLFKAIGMPNVMIKVPATKAGYEAMKLLLKDGINVNATLVFSPEQTKKCLEAMKEGSDEFALKSSSKRTDVSFPKAVISVFVSRFDRILDSKFKEMGMPTLKFGIFNALKCYEIIEKEDLQNVKTLFASVGVKGNEVKPTYYVDELLLEDSVNTAPITTIKALVDTHGTKFTITNPSNIGEIDKYLKDVESKIDINKIYDELLQDGIKQFINAFDEILKSI